LQPPFAQNGTVVNLRMSTRFCTKGDGFQFLAKFAILPQNANSRSNQVQAAVSSEAAAFLLSADIIKTGKILRRCITLDSLIMMMSLP
ncbi:hypothetical protein, partial [Klebsiella pneumoniae]|uniref:hypothetical protein n=1 Tax=Klebsiella pneumoniae TaxID=573 RepID=UPI001CDAFE6D